MVTQKSRISYLCATCGDTAPVQMDEWSGTVDPYERKDLGLPPVRGCTGCHGWLIARETSEIVLSPSLGDMDPADWPEYEPVGGREAFLPENQEYVLVCGACGGLYGDFYGGTEIHVYRKHGPAPNNSYVVEE